MSGGVVLVAIGFGKIVRLDFFGLLARSPEVHYAENRSVHRDGNRTKRFKFERVPAKCLQSSREIPAIFYGKGRATVKVVTPLSLWAEIVPP